MIRVLRILARLNVGGPAIHATLLAERLDASRYESTLVTGAEGPEEGNYLDLHGRSVRGLVTLPSLGREIRGPQDLGSLAALIRLMRRVRPHIVHTHAAKAGTLGRLAARLTGVPVIVHTYHGHVLRGYFPPARERVYRGIERYLARQTDELVAVTPRVRGELLDMGIGAPDRFSVVPLGFDLDRFTRAAMHRGHLRRELGAPTDAPLVGIVARLVPIKAHDVFLTAAAAVRRARPATRFVIVGDGERRAQIVADIERLGLRDAVHLLGWRADLERIYADLDVAVLTSRNEGSPVALIEAMAAGVPVVATAVGGVPDVVEDGVTGRLAPDGDAAAVAARILEAIDRGVAAPLVDLARRRVLERYGADRLVTDIDELYGRLLRRKGAA